MTPCHHALVEIRRIVAERAEDIGSVAPALLDLHPKAQIDPAPEEAFHILARVRTDLFEHLAALSDEYALMRRAFAVDRRVHVGDVAVLALLKALDNDGGAVRYFLVGQAEYFFSDDLAGR